MIDKFASEASAAFNYFKDFRQLYYEDEKQIELLNDTAKGFFIDLFNLYLKQIVIDVSRLMEALPQKRGQGRAESLKFSETF